MNLRRPVLLFLLATVALVPRRASCWTLPALPPPHSLLLHSILRTSFPGRCFRLFVLPVLRAVHSFTVSSFHARPKLYPASWFWILYHKRCTLYMYRDEQ